MVLLCSCKQSTVTAGKEKKAEKGKSTGDSEKVHFFVNFVTNKLYCTIKVN